MKKKIAVSLIFSVAISALALFFAFRNVPFPDLVNYIGSIDWAWVGFSLFFLCASFLIRVLRWQTIIKSAGPLTFWKAFHPMMIGFAVNCILPGRVGEAARPLILAQKGKIPFATTLGTVAVERLFDIIFLCLCLAALFFTVEMDPALDIPFGAYHLNRDVLETIAMGMMKLVALIFLGMALIIMRRTRAIISRVINGLMAPIFFLFPGLKKKGQTRSKPGIADNLAQGFAMIKSVKKTGVCIIYTAVIWFFSAMSIYVMSKGSPGIDLSFLEMAAVMVIICFFIALPSVPGFWGIWEAGGVFALALFGAPQTEAAGFILTNHAVQIFPVVIVGLISALITGINILQTFQTKKEIANGSA
jgi:glycosyltransferase 2 family protein